MLAMTMHPFNPCLTACRIPCIQLVAHVGLRSPVTCACHRFGYHSLLTMLAWYFLGASVASGSAISSGLFVPMLMMGATIGRICGLATVDIAEHVGQYIAGTAALLQRAMCRCLACYMCGL
jgi:H+/Cl- antiporter ClcA